MKSKDWDTYARENPDTPLSKNEAASYLDHVIGGWNRRAHYLDAVKEWEKLPWWKRLFTFRPQP